MPTFTYDGVSVRNQRPTNMDTILVNEKEIDGVHICIAAVCDGVGSKAEGLYAASVAVRSLNGWFESLADRKKLGVRLREHVLEVNRYIVRMARENGIHTAATISAILVEEDHYFLVHMGDSRIYRYSSGEFYRLTPDHVREGKLTSYLGKVSNIQLFWDEGRCEKGVYLLCSDGLYRRMDEEFLQKMLRKLSKKRLRKTMEEMIQYAIDKGETDNISIAVIRKD